MQNLGRTPDPATHYGTAEHAADLTKGRHPGVHDALQWLTFAHLPETLQTYSRPFYGAAVALIDTIRTDSTSLTTALNKLVEAKDAGVRAGIINATGRAGSIPRPREVENVPLPSDE